MTTTLRTEQLRRPRAVWWTLLVAVLFALAPTLTHALAHGGMGGVGGAQRLEICTAQGPQSVAPDTAQAVDAPVGQDAQPHCPFCLHQADRMDAPPQPLPCCLTVLGGPQAMRHWPAFFYFDKTSRWAPARGPPLASGS